MRDARRHAARLLPMVLTLAGAGCGKDAARPADAPTGRYALVSVDGKLPYTVEATPFSHKDVVSGSLEFLSRGRLLETRQYVTYGSGPDLPSGDTAAFAYSAAADGLVIARPSFVPADSWADTAAFAGARSELTVTVHHFGPSYGPKATLVYHKAP